jgi:hypothetical protein
MLLTHARTLALEALLWEHTLVYDRRHVDVIMLAWELVVDRGASEARVMGDLLILDGVDRPQFWLRMIHAVFGADTEVQVFPGLGTPEADPAALCTSLVWWADGACYMLLGCPEGDGGWFLHRMSTRVPVGWRAAGRPPGA